jgi:hypothetical protein
MIQRGDKLMNATRMLLLTTAILLSASPAMAGDTYRWWPWSYRSADAPQGWVCYAFEHRNRCNAELNVRTGRCGCIER